LEVNDAEIPASPRLSQGNARIFPSRPVFAGMSQDIFDFAFIDVMLVDVGLSGPWIDVVPDLHCSYCSLKP